MGETFFNLDITFITLNITKKEKLRAKSLLLSNVKFFPFGKIYLVESQFYLRDYGDGRNVWNYCRYSRRIC